jgi:hypothetical protein
MQQFIRRARRLPNAPLAKHGRDTRRHGPQEFQLDIIHHSFETHNQAISAAGASKKTEIGVRY